MAELREMFKDLQRFDPTIFQHRQRNISSNIPENPGGDQCCGGRVYDCDIGQSQGSVRNLVVSFHTENFVPPSWEGFDRWATVPDLAPVYQFDDLQCALDTFPNARQCH